MLPLPTKKLIPKYKGNVFVATVESSYELIAGTSYAERSIPIPTNGLMWADFMGM